MRGPVLVRAGPGRLHAAGCDLGAAPAVPGGRDILNAIYDSLKKGIDVKAILNQEVDFSELEDSSTIKNLMMHMGTGFNCRMAGIPATPFHIIDRENVLLEMLNPLSPDELFALINIRDAKLAEELREKFFTIWENAEPYTGKSCFEK